MSSSTENPTPPNETLPPAQPDNSNIPPNEDRTEESSKDALPQKIAELVDAFPKEQRAEIISNLLEKLEVNDEKGYMSMASMTHFSGPFPHPDILKGMNDVVPGAAREVIDMAITQSKHRQAVEKKAVNSQLWQSQLGQIFGFIIAVLGLLGAISLINKGHDAAGATIGSIDLVGLVSVFVLGRNSQKKQLERKKDS